MAVTIEVTLNRFGAFAGTLDAMLQRALDAGVLACIATADPLTRVDTGAMRANKSISGGGDARTITWNQHYSGYNEFGTYKMAAQPFARPGADAALPVIEAELGGWP
jgi:HK97 gp10 family phage protein